jgi:adenine-specific DNA-methyltransferase
MQLTTNKISEQKLEEAIFFLSFLQERSLDYKKSEYLSEYFAQAEISSFELLSIRPPSNFTELIHHMEELIPSNDRTINGAFFTPEYIVNYIINEANPQENEAVLDPSCGCGAFLLGVIRFFETKYSKTVKDIVKENVYGVDILSYNIEFVFHHIRQVVPK